MALQQINDLPGPLAATLALRAADFGIPGLAIALVAPGRKARFTFGVDAAGSTRPVGDGTWFSLASLAKHITAAAVLELAQAGRVELAAPVERYLADLPPAWRGRSVQGLMQHVSGLPEYLAHGEGDEGAPVPESRVAFMRTYGHLQPLFAEGEGWMYGNTNYILLGFLVAQLAGQPFAAAVQALFDRHGCRGATVAGPAWTREANAAGLGPGARDEASWRREVIGDGDASFTVQGACGWLEALLGGRLLAPAALATMFRPALLATGRPAHYGCGWFVDSLRGEPIGHHGGHYDGWTTMAYLAPSAGAGVIAMCNLAPGNTRAIRCLAQAALEAFQPGSTPLSLPTLVDDAPELTATVRAQLLRRGAAPDPACFAEELQRVIRHGTAARGVLDLWAGEEPLGFELV
jgi:CubicO group peptidase (beta-lactamase class C family)